MADDASAQRSPRLTARGAVTRARILAVAGDLMYARGVGGTSLDDVMAASGTGRSQLYHYFADKDALIVEVVTMQVEHLLEAQRALLGRVDSIRGFERWRDAEVMDARTHHGAHGCPIGSLASELAEQSESARTILAAGFATWEGYLADGLTRMRDAGALGKSADPAALAAGIMAALQGGMLLAQATRDPDRVATALDLALSHVRTLGPARTARRR